jgi:hypothetical protein
MSGWLEAFIVVAVIAIVIQTCIFVALFVSIRATTQQLVRIITDLQGRIDPILTRTNRILENSEDRINSVMADTAEITQLARIQVQKVDRVFTEAVERLRVQVVRADRIISGTLEVVEEAGSTVRRTVWEPVNQVSAILKGIKIGLDVFRRPRKRSESSVPQDEELFI